MFLLSTNLENKATQLLSDDEGFRSKMYKCPRGFNTIGYGFNLDTNELPEVIAKLWLRYLIEQLSLELNSKLSFFKNLDDARKYVLINMAYQMGVNGLLGFKKFLSFLEQNKYKEAVSELEDSQWHRDFPNRSNRLISIMIKGDF